MQRVSLKEFRNVAVGVGLPGVVGLLIANAAVSVYPALSQVGWWRACMTIFILLSVSGGVAFVLPLAQGLRFRVPWYAADFKKAIDTSAPLPLTQEQIRICLNLSSIAALYGRTKSLQTNIEAFLSEMEADKPNKTGLHDATKEFILFMDRNQERYKSEYKDELVKLATILRLEFGIMPVGLTDGAILNESILPNSVRPIRNGLAEASAKLSQIITEKASKL